MNINLHIERLVLDGLNVEPGHDRVINRTVRAELTRLLSEGGLAPGLQSGAAVPHVRADSIALEGNGTPLSLGREIARSVYSGIGEQS